MSDFNSSLPVRTVHNGDVVVNVSDGTTETQLLSIDASGRVTTKMDDGSGNPITSQANGGQRALDIGIDVGGVQIDPRQIRLLTSADVVTVDQGTTPWITKDVADGSVTGGTAGTFSLLVGGIYNSTLPTLTTGQQVALQTDSSGRLLVNFENTSIIVTQGTTPWITSDLADGAVANGAAGTKSMLGGLIYLAAAPTITTGNQNSLLGDIHGNLLVNLQTALPTGSNVIGAVTQSGGPWTSNITQIGGSALALGQTTMANSIPVTFASNQSALSIAGNLTNNNAAPAATNLGVLPALAEGTINASRYTTGDQVLLVTDLAGNTNMDLQYYLGAAVSTTNPIATTISDGTHVITNAISAYGTAPTGTEVMGVNAYITNTVPVSQSGTWTVQPGNTPNTVPWLVTVSTALPSGTNTIGKVEITDGTNTVGVTPASTAATATQPAEVVALSPNSPLPAGTNAIGSVLANLQVANAAVSNTNPVPVTLTTTSPGTAIQAYYTSVALAAGSSVTFTYTVAATHTFNLSRIWSSASGKIKSVVQNNGSTIFVGFNSTANPNIDMTVVSQPTIVAGNTVTVTITNDDLAPFDVYATVEGNQN